MCLQYVEFQNGDTITNRVKKYRMSYKFKKGTYEENFPTLQPPCLILLHVAWLISMKQFLSTVFVVHVTQYVTYVK